MSESKKSQYILLFLMAFLISGCIVGGTFIWRWMQKPASFPIKQIRVEGQLTHEKPAQVTKLLQSTLSGGFFSLNISAAKEALLSFPWIAHVSFRRVWPNTIVVKIAEQQPVARFGKTGIVNPQGVIFYPPISTISQDLPELIGEKDQAAQLLEAYYAFNTAIKNLGLTVTQLRVDATQNWYLQFSNHLQVIVGRDDVSERFQRFVAIYPKILNASNKTISLIDLRYPNGVAVRYS